MRAYAGTRVASCAKYKRDKFVRPYVGYENMRTGEIQWYNQGIYLVNNPQWSYNASTNEISMQALDLMSKLTGLRNGNLEGIPTKIAKDENVREAIISTLALGGFTKYVCEECKTKDGTIVPVPYDIEIDVGGTVYDVLTGLRDIMPNYQIYFDINGVFHYEPIPLAYDDPVLIDDDLFNNVLISENINTDFESVKNYVEVLGHTWDVDYYSPSESTTVSGGTITPTFADLTALEDGTAVGITLPSDVEIGEPRPSILPEGYTELEYIQSSGTQYINTRFIPTSNTKLSIDFQVLSGGDDNTIIGTINPNCVIGYNTTEIHAGFKLGTGTPIAIATTVTSRHTAELSNGVFKVDAQQKSFDQVTGFSQTLTALIFASHYTGVSDNAYGKCAAKVYSAKIYESGVLVRDFIPCKNASGVVGMWDDVNSVFYQNAGTGTFIAGPETPPVVVDKITINYLGNNDVVDIDDKPIKKLSKDTEWIFQFVPGPKLPSGYTQLEYIQSSGTQYINTGFKSPSSGLKIALGFEYIADHSGETLFGCQKNGVYSICPWANPEFYVGSTGRLLPYSAELNTRYNLVVEAKNNKLTTTWNEISYTGSYSGSLESTQDIYLFANHIDNSVGQIVSIKLYECSMYANDVMTRNFIPCKNPSGIIGLYDSVNSVFYANAGSGAFVAGPEIPSTEDKGGPFWRFMGHQQAQATSYDNNPSSPFYVGDPIGSSSVGRIRIVLYGGEYDNIYSDDLAKQRADFEIYQRSRLNDSISMETIPIPWMDANIVISHRFGQKQEPSKYIVKSFSVDYATGGTMTINAISWYPYYEESEVV